MDELSLAVVGIGFPNRDGGDRRFELLLCAPGEPVALLPEPRNAHDPHAVAVFSARGVQIGYLTAERAPWIRRRLAQAEARAVFQRLEASSAVIRVRFGGGAPTLPASDGEGMRHADDRDADGPDWGA